MMLRDGGGRLLPSVMMTSPDLRAAFLERLGETGSVVYAAAALGIAPATAYRARRTFRDFAAGWEAALARAAPRTRRGGEIWPLAARTAFADALGEGKTPAQAAAHAGYPLASAYRMRAASPVFAAAWDGAQARVIDLIEAEVQQRALHGVRRTVTRDGVPTETLEFSERLAILLLKAWLPARYDPPRAAAAAPAPATLDRSDILARFKAMARRLAGSAATVELAGEHSGEQDAVAALAGPSPSGDQACADVTSGRDRPCAA